MRDFMYLGESIKEEKVIKKRKANCIGPHIIKKKVAQLCDLLHGNYVQLKTKYHGNKKRK